jgi:hypothetical protein
VQMLQAEAARCRSSLTARGASPSLHREPGEVEGRGVRHPARSVPAWSDRGALDRGMRAVTIRTATLFSSLSTKASLLRAVAEENEVQRTSLGQDAGDAVC